MWKYLYANSRDWRFDSPMKIEDVTMNGGYCTRFFNYGQFADFAAANIVTLSMPIMNDRYVGKVPVIDPITEEPTGKFVPKLTKFVMLRYSDKFTNAENLKASVEKTGSNTGVQVFATPELAAEWIRNNTDLVETEIPGKFVISEAHLDPMTQKEVSAQYLEII